MILDMKTSFANSNKPAGHKHHYVQVLFCVLGFLAPFASVRAATLPVTGKILPPETIVLLNIDDFQQLKTQFEKTCLYNLYKDPAMTDFVENAKTKLQEKIQQLDDNDILKTIFNTELRPQGRVIFAMVLDEQTRDLNEPQIVIITEWGESVDKIKEAVNEMLQKNIEYGGHQKSSEDYRGVSIQISIDEASAVLSHCFIDDCFIATTSLDIIKFIIAHIKGSSSPSLADDTDYTTTMKATGPYHDFDFYVNLKQIIKSALAKDLSGQASQRMAGLGFDNVTAIGWSAAFARNPGNSSSGKGFIKVNGAKRGICKMLEVDSAVIKAPRFISAQAYSTTFFNLDIKKAYGELYNILYSFNPQYTSMLNILDLPDSPEGEPGVKLKDDVINHLGSQIIVSQSLNKPFSSTSTPSESLVAIAVSNRGAIEKSLSLLHSKRLAANDPDAKRELLGHTIYMFNFSALPFFGGGGASPGGVPQTVKLAFTMTDTHLLFASESVIERAIRTLTNTDSIPISSAKWFTAAKSTIPSAVGLATLQNNAASSELFWWTIKQGTAQQANPGLMQLNELVNFALLPEFDTVRKYFGSSAFYGISRPDGFFFETRDLNPPNSD